jgi:hypothetical protein
VLADSAMPIPIFVSDEVRGLSKDCNTLLELQFKQSKLNL